jgi:protein TonB
MTHLFVLWLALFAAQATTPVTQPAAPAPDQAAPAEPLSPNPNFSGLYEASSDVTPPRILYQPEPQYSEIARQQKINGTVTVFLIVDTEGNPRNVKVIKSIADTVGENQRAAALTLDQAAVDAVKQYKFAPAAKDGVPVEVYLNVKVNFEIH